MILCLRSGSKQLVLFGNRMQWERWKSNFTHVAYLNSDFVGMAERLTDLADLVPLSGAVSTAVAGAITEALRQRQWQSRGEAGSVQARAVPSPQSRAGSSSS